MRTFLLSHILDDNTAVRLGASGVGGDVIHLLESRMDHMTLVSVHGFQSGAAMCLQNLLCLLGSIATQGILTLLAVSLSIHIDADVAFHTTVDGVVCQVLDGIPNWYILRTFVSRKKGIVPD